MLPVQAITSVLYLATCLVSIWLFLSSCFLPAYVLCLVVTQGWRAISEVFRADYRGGGKVSAYQIMSVAGACYCLVIAVVFQSFQELFPYTAPPVPPVNIAAGLKSLWTPGIILFLQAIWLTMFLFTGRSMVTGSTLSFYVHRHRV